MVPWLKTVREQNATDAETQNAVKSSDSELHKALNPRDQNAGFGCRMFKGKLRTWGARPQLELLLNSVPGLQKSWHSVSEKA